MPYVMLHVGVQICTNLISRTNLESDRAKSIPPNDIHKYVSCDQCNDPDIIQCKFDSIFQYYLWPSLWLHDLKRLSNVHTVVDLQITIMNALPLVTWSLYGHNFWPDWWWHWTYNCTLICIDKTSVLEQVKWHCTGNTVHMKVNDKNRKEYLICQED